MPKANGERERHKTPTERVTAPSCAICTLLAHVLALHFTGIFPQTLCTRVQSVSSLPHHPHAPPSPFPPRVMLRERPPRDGGAEATPGREKGATGLRAAAEQGGTAFPAHGHSANRAPPPKHSLNGEKGLSSLSQTAPAGVWEGDWEFGCVLPADASAPAAVPDSQISPCGPRRAQRG